MTGDARPGLPPRHGPDLEDLAAFTVNSAGVVTSWPECAARLSGQPAGAVMGQDVRDVLLTGPGQPELAGRALAEVAAGRVWSGTVTGGRLGDGRFTTRWEPLRPPDGAVVLFRRAWPRRHHRWLSVAAAGIGGTLDLNQTAAEVAEVTVPAFADAVAIYVAEHLLAADETAAPRAGRGLAARRLGYRLASGADSPAPPGDVIIFAPGTPGFQAMTTEQPVLFGRLDADIAARASHYPGASQAAARYSSFLAMPLTARDTVVGCLMFCRTAASAPFSTGELAGVGELAGRAAMWIDNARLYHREQRTARALQQGLLPRIPDAPPGLEIASRYLPVGTNVVGGDWHDVVALPGGRAAIVVGDAMGHGPEAAAAMAQLRSAAHVLADLELPPRQLLYRLDRMVAEITTAPFATCVCAVASPPAGPGADGWSCSAGRAGHPPPAVILPGGKARLLDLPAGLPLGLGEESFEETLTLLPAGATLALYTDGLVESRSRPIDEGMAALLTALSAALATPGASLDTACEEVIQRLSGQHEDDITLVLARIRC